MRVPERARGQFESIKIAMKRSLNARTHIYVKMISACFANQREEKEMKININMFERGVARRAHVRDWKKAGKRNDSNARDESSFFLLFSSPDTWWWTLNRHSRLRCINTTNFFFISWKLPPLGGHPGGSDWRKRLYWVMQLIETQLKIPQKTSRTEIWSREWFAKLMNVPKTFILWWSSWI